MTEEHQGESAFSLRSIGVEPAGATPIEAEDLEGLIPAFVSTRADLNQVEFENISRSLAWARRQARRLGPIELLEEGFLFELHRRMFGDVWKWAGTQRRRESNIGVAPHDIPAQLHAALGDARYWHEHDVFLIDERAARIHYRLVTVHPFRNGNGRCTRLLADLYLIASGKPSFSWGRSRLDTLDEARRTYLAALEAAHDDNLPPLVDFARS